jgi:hypothetical protein
MTPERDRSLRLLTGVWRDLAAEDESQAVPVVLAAQVAGELLAELDRVRDLNTKLTNANADHIAARIRADGLLELYTKPCPACVHELRADCKDCGLPGMRRRLMAADEKLAKSTVAAMRAETELGTATAQLDHEYKRATQLAELHRIANEAISRATAAGIRAERQRDEALAELGSLRDGRG